MRHNCPICYEYIFYSLKETTIMKCEHTMHSACLSEMMKNDIYTCPICSKSVIDMSRIWRKMDEKVEAKPMPEDFKNLKVWILCYDCTDTTELFFQIVGHKCRHCQSYNTRMINPSVLPQ